MPADSTTRHAVARTTGATTLAQKQEDGSWTIQCLNHSTSTTDPSRGATWKTASHPEAWCAGCKKIAAGKTEKITDGLLEIPKPKPVKKAAAKQAAKGNGAIQPGGKSAAKEA